VTFECLKRSVQSVSGSYAFPYVFDQSMRAAPQHVITGASSGIGAALVSIYSRRGARLPLIARTDHELKLLRVRPKDTAVT
jgi:NADPH:quinone reductase-like Zn-dependent oxidoreductase